MQRDPTYDKLKIGKTYGEPTYEKMEQIWQKMKEGYFNRYSSSFLDIGSGFGKLVLLIGTKDDIVAHGIEIVPFRIKYTQILLKKLLKEQQNNAYL